MGVRRYGGQPQQMSQSGRRASGLVRRATKVAMAFVGDNAAANWLIRKDGTYFNLAPPASTGTVSQSGVTFSKDGRLCATAFSNNNTPGHQARVWDVAAGTVAQSLPTFCTTTPRRPKFSPDGRFLAFAGYVGTPSIIVFNTTTWAAIPLPNLPARCDQIAFTPDGNYLLCTTGTTPYLHIYDTATWTKQTVSFGAGVPNGITYAIDINTAGNRVALSVGGWPYVIQYNYFINAGVHFFSIQSHLSPSPGAGFSAAEALSYSKDGRYLFIGTGSTSEYAYIYDLANYPISASKEPTPASPAITWPVISGGFSGRAKKLIMVADGGTVARQYTQGTWQAIAFPAAIANSLATNTTLRACAIG